MGASTAKVLGRQGPFAGEDRSERPCGHHFSPLAARSGAQVHDEVRAPDRLFVVLDDDDGIPAVSEHPQDSEEALVVPRVQPDRGLVQDVAEPAHVGGQLGHQPHPAGLPLAQGVGGPSQAEIPEPDLVHQLEPFLEFLEDRLGDLLLALPQVEGVEELLQLARGQGNAIGDVLPVDPDGKGPLPESGPVTFRAGLPIRAFGPVLPVSVAGPAVRRDDAQAVAFAAGPVAAVEGKEPWVRLGKADPALPAEEPPAVVPLLPSLVRNHTQIALPDAEGLFDLLLEVLVRDVTEIDLCNDHIDVVLFVAVHGKDVLDRHHRTVQAHVGVAHLSESSQEFTVVPLLALQDGREQADRLLPEVGAQVLVDPLRGLVGEPLPTARAVGGTDLGEQEPEIMVDLCEGCHGGASAAPGELLLHGNGGRNALDPVHVRLGHGLNVLAGIGGQALQEPSLPFGEEDVKGKGGLARAAGPGDHDDLVSGDGKRDFLQVVLPGPLDRDVAPLPVGRGASWSSSRPIGGFP